MTQFPVTGLPSPPCNAPDQRDATLRAAATELEAGFLAEMLQHAGLGAMKGSFGGGVGEEQFNSFLVREQAAQLAQRGGIGLAETIFEAMKLRMETCDDTSG